MRAVVIFTVMGLCAVGAACAPQPATATAESAVTAAPAAPVATTTPAWRYALPPHWEFSQVYVGETAVVIAGRADLRVLDPATGRLRWHHDGGASTMALSEDAVYYGTSETITARALTSGRALWERGAACPSATDDTAVGGVSVIVRHAGDLLAGCRGGRLIRLAAASGRIVAHSDNAFEAETIANIVPLGACAYGVSGWSSGAALRPHAAIVNCKSLTVIVPEQDDMVIVGTIGNIAVLDERCCNGRPDVYRPATIVRANLTSGALSPEVDLTPEPSLYPADHRPIGQGSAALLEGTELYLFVERALYRYGDPRALPAMPQRIAADLVEIPTLLRHGLLAVRLRGEGGAISDEIVRLRNGRLEPIWSSPESRPVLFSADGGGADVLTIRYADASGGQMLVRADDAASLFITGPCRLYGASRDLALMLCTTNTLIGNRYLQYFAAYRWPGAPR